MSKDREKQSFRVIVRYSAAYPSPEDYAAHILTLQNEPANYTPRVPEEQFRELVSLGGNAWMFYPTVPEDGLAEELLADGYDVYLGSHWVPLHFRAKHGVQEGDARLFDYLLAWHRKHPGKLWWGCASESGMNDRNVQWLVGLPGERGSISKADAFRLVRGYYLEQALANTGCRHFFYSQKRLGDLRDRLFDSWRSAGCPRVEGMEPMGFGHIAEHAHRAGAPITDYNLVAGDGLHTHTYHYMPSFGASRVQGEYNAGCPACQPSVAFLRGAARMAGVPSMVHWSAWGGCEGAAQSFDSQGNISTGYSPSVQLRQWVFAWLAGINTITAFEEASRQVWYHDAQGVRHLTPSAENLKRFTSLALEQGLPGAPPTQAVKPYVPIALMLERHHGWTPGYEDIWWGAAPWTRDEDNIRAFFRAAWPSHEMTQGGVGWGKWSRSKQPWRDADDLKRLRAEGLHSEDFEKGLMSETRWGDTFDAITKDAPDELLAQYKVIVLLGGLKLDPDLRIRLQDYVEAGGIVVANAPQINRSSERCLGVRLGHTPPGSRNDGLPFDITLTDAEKLDVATPAPSVTDPGQAHPAPLTDVPWVTRAKRGRGWFYLTTLDYAARGAMDLYAPGFFDGLFGGFTPVRLESERMGEVSWMLNELPGGWALTVMHHGPNYWQLEPDAWCSGRLMQPWTGIATFDRASIPPNASARDLWTGSPTPLTDSPSGPRLTLTIPPGGLAICAVTAEGGAR